MSTPASPDLITEYASQLAQAATRLTKARRNLNDAQPGYPTSTPGAQPATGTNSTIDPEGHIHLTIVERLASTTDQARQDKELLDKLTTHIGPLIHEIWKLTTRWGNDPTHLNLDPPVTDEYCTSCLRIHACNPRYRGDLCRWCYDFKAIEHRLPSAGLLEQRRQGTHITQAMVANDRHTDAPRSRKKVRR